MVSPKQNACRYCGGFGTVPYRKMYEAETKQGPCPHCQPVHQPISSWMDCMLPKVPHREGGL